MADQTRKKTQSKNISSADELDRLLRVTSPIGWFALLGFGALIMATVIWGIFGKIPTQVQGEGILIRTGGIFDIVALSSGQLTAVETAVGEKIKKGDVVARIAQPSLLMDINNAAAELRAMRADLEHMGKLVQRDIRLNKEQTKSETEQIRRAIQFSQEQLKWLTQKLHDQETLLQEGLITKQRYFDTKRMINSILERIQMDENRIHAGTVKSLEFAERRQQEVRNFQMEVARKARALKAMRDRFDQHTKVLSPFSGLIVELTAEVGKTIAEGQPILRMELTEKKTAALQALVYVSPLKGEKVRPGMLAHLIPVTVRPEQYGFMLGKVSYVSVFPASFKGMMRLLENEELVRRLSEGGAPIQIYVELQTDPANPSGYAWSSRKGPLTRVESGTLCSVSIVTSEKSPIMLLLPSIHQALAD